MDNTQEFSQIDFGKNPEKYSQFKTARISKNVSISKELDVGKIVNLEFFNIILNPFFGNVLMPVYIVWPKQEQKPKAGAKMLFASALTDFS